MASGNGLCERRACERVFKYTVSCAINGQVDLCEGHRKEYVEARTLPLKGWREAKLEGMEYTFPQDLIGGQVLRFSKRAKHGSKRQSVPEAVVAKVRDLQDGRSMIFFEDALLDVVVIPNAESLEDHGIKVVSE